MEQVKVAIINVNRYTYAPIIWKERYIFLGDEQVAFRAVFLWSALTSRECRETLILVFECDCVCMVVYFSYNFIYLKPSWIGVWRGKSSFFTTVALFGLNFVHSTKVIMCSISSFYLHIFCSHLKYIHLSIV